MSSDSGEELASIVRFADALPAAIWVGRAPTGEVVYVNREFERILGISPPEGAARGNYVGPYGVHLPSGAAYPEHAMPFERVMRSKETEVIDDIVIHRHDGSKCHLRVVARPLFDDRGEITHVVEAFTDITREVEAERRRAETDRQLQAVRRLDTIGSLAGGVAHDFNNLLAVVKLVATRLRHERDEGERARLVGHLDEVADSAAKLTHALLGFAQCGTHVTRPLSVNELAASVVELARRTFDRRIEIVAELEAARDIIVGEPAQIEQVLINLVMNARDAIPADVPGRIAIRTRRESVGAGHALLEPGDHVIIEVEDTGTGIDAAIRERAFEPYVTTKGLGTTKGTGLGLATVFGVARGHGGTAEIVSTGSEGTLMRVFLPATISRSLPPVAPPRPTALVRGRGTVLVIDDEPLVLRMTARTLEELGYDVIHAPSGDDGVEAFRSATVPIAAVVLDIVMPGLNGRETCRALRALDPDVRVLLMSGYALDADTPDTSDFGALHVLAKPFDPTELSRALAAVATR
ncbi:MAG: response regulator [Myxococcota bacterium]|nr:response regulator [Myxococcota bacterium]